MVNRSLRGEEICLMINWNFSDLGKMYIYMYMFYIYTDYYILDMISFSYFSFNRRVHIFIL